MTDQRKAIDERVAGQTVGQLFLRTVSSRPDAVALRWREADGETWGEWTWAEYADRVARVAAGLRARGVGKGDRVVLMMRNRPEFHVADTAVMFLGGTAISIYNSSAPEQVQYLVDHSGACAGIFEDTGYLERVLKVRSELPKLRDLVIVDDPDGLAPREVGRFADLCAAAPLDLDQEVDNATPETIATVIYTSGTTGPPKGVVLDHANICWTVESYRLTLGTEPVGWRAVSYLPMAHIAERMLSHYLGIAEGFEVTTCPEPSLVAQYLPNVRPQTFFAVPRVWEKLYNGLQSALNASPEQAKQGEAALAVGWEVSEYRARDEALPADLVERYEPVRPLLDGVMAMIGLDQAQICVTGAAPIPIEVLQFFRSLGLPLSEIYGLSETSGPMTWEPYRVRVGCVGKAMPGIEVVLGEDGEVLCRGGNVFRGYLNAPDKTDEVLDHDGWFHTGDIGVLDDDGFLKIVDRKKELIITAGGKNISPANLEAALKAGQLIGQACVIGDNKPFMAALLVLDPDTAPAWAKSHGIEAASLSALAEHPDVRAEVEREVAEANARFSRVEQIKKFTILHDEWMPDSEELTPTMKLKRRGVLGKYADEIEALYA